MLGQLKQALEDQDATIELQEKALSQKEDEIAALQKGTSCNTAIRINPLP